MSDIFRSVTPLVNESLPLENLFMAIFSRNHIEKQVFNIGDLSPMWFHLEPDIAFTMHEVIRDKWSSYKIQDRVITHCGHLYQHVRVWEKEDCDTDEVCEEVDIHYIICIYYRWRGVVGSKLYANQRYSICLLWLGYFTSWCHSRSTLHWYYRIPQVATLLVIWTLGGVAIHYAFGVNTMLGHYLGLNPLPVRAECA